MAISAFFSSLVGRDRERAARRRLFRGVEEGRGVWEGCVRGTGDDAGGVVVVEDEDARRERAGWLGPVCRPALRAVAPSPSRASDSGREADIPAISCEYIATLMLEILLKVSERLDDIQVRSRARHRTCEKY